MRHPILNLVYILSFCTLLITACAQQQQQEIKKAFDIVNESTKGIYTEKKDSLLNAIKNHKDYTEVKEKVDIGGKAYIEYNKFLDSLKQRIILSAGGVDSNGEIANGFDLSISDSIMLGLKQSEVLLSKMSKAKLQMSAATTDSFAIQKINTLLTPSRAPKNKDFAEYTFGHIPVVATITILTKFENDLNEANNQMLQGVLRDIERK